MMSKFDSLHKLQLMTELSRKQILAKIDKDFIHHGEYTRELPMKNRGGSVFQNLTKYRTAKFTDIQVNFMTDSATFSGDKEYHQKILLSDLMPILRKKDMGMTLRQKLYYAINEGDLRLSCDCKAFRYWGYAYIVTQLKINHPSARETRPPKVRNPNRKGIVCKHLDLVLRVLPFNVMDMLKYLKEWGYKDDTRTLKG